MEGSIKTLIHHSYTHVEEDKENYDNHYYYILHIEQFMGFAL